VFVQICHYEKTCVHGNIKVAILSNCNQHELNNDSPKIQRYLFRSTAFKWRSLQLRLIASHVTSRSLEKRGASVQVQYSSTLIFFLKSMSVFQDVALLFHICS
jgi:hypothetical protein